MPYGFIFDHSLRGVQMTAHAFEFTTIDHQPLPLKNFQGHPLLIVNTASECGYTPQYADLQKLWQRYRERGLMVLGVPSNDFGQQEPGNEQTIQAFCRANYGVDFPLTAKQRVIGGEAHPLYRWLVEQVGEDGAPRWNFHKYLLDADGNLVDMWPSRVAPLADEITTVIEALL
jgi:glutathione peroxidase